VAQRLVSRRPTSPLVDAGGRSVFDHRRGAGEAMASARGTPTAVGVGGAVVLVIDRAERNGDEDVSVVAVAAGLRSVAEERGFTALRPAGEGLEVLVCEATTRALRIHRADP
jgi:hypothetical protein